MRKQITALLTVGVMLLQCAPLSAFADVIEVTPGNMVFLDVVNASGNSVEGVKVSLYNDAGTEIGGIWNDKYFFESNDSGIDGTELGERYNYYVPWNAFTPYVSLQTLHSVNICRADLDNDYYDRYQNEPIYVGSGSPYKVQLFSYDASQATALTVPANRFGVYVDPKWENRTAVGYVTTPASTLYFNRKGEFDLLESLTTVPTGKVQLYEPLSTEYEPRMGLDFDGGGGSGSSYPVKLSDAATQYVLCRLPLQQLCPYFREDGKYESNGLLYDLQQDTKYTHAILVIQSGAVLNAVIPDDSGYVEFYLDRASREYALDFSYDYRNVPNGNGTVSGGGSGFSYSGIAANISEHYLEPVSIPEDEIILTYVPAGTYTLVYDNIPEGYAAPKTTAITVTDSKKIQYIPLVLEDALLLGDVNSDKQINAADAALLLKAASMAGMGGTSGLTSDQETAADVNADGAFDAKDAALILQYAAYAGTGGTMTIEEFLAEIG